MSSFGKKLAAEFESEFARLASDWYMKWHDLARGETIEIEDFRGGLIRPSFNKFDAAAELAYWAATRRYIDNKTEHVFSRIEHEIGSRKGGRAAAVIDEGAIALRAFLERLHRHAVFTEYRLQARGFPDHRYLKSRRNDSISIDVRQRKMALLEKYAARSWIEKFTETLVETTMRPFILMPALVAAMAVCLIMAFFYNIDLQ